MPEPPIKSGCVVEMGDLPKASEIWKSGLRKTIMGVDNHLFVEENGHPRGCSRECRPNLSGWAGCSTAQALAFTSPATPSMAQGEPGICPEGQSSGDFWTYLWCAAGQLAVSCVGHCTECCAVCGISFGYQQNAAICRNQ